MRLFLTSSPCSPYPQEDGRILYGYNKENGFLERFCQGWEPGCQCVMISSDPGDFGHNDKMRGEFEGFFQISGIPVSRLVMVDDRGGSFPASFGELCGDPGGRPCAYPEQVFQKDQA